ncbi:MAG: hypothetical protein IJW59_01940 [Clostridia bacterium]|nr:hypothetical protein [Clostridia bacterium]
MIYKNSIKILFSNFGLVWKMLLYFFLVFSGAVLLVYLLMSPVVKIIDHAGFFNQIVDLYTDFLKSLNLTETLTELSLIIENVFQFIIDNMSKMWLSFVGVGIVVLFLNSLLFNLATMANCASLHLYMGSMTRQGFFSSFSDCFKKNIKAQLLYFLINLPLNILFVGLFILSLKLFRGAWYMSLLAVFVIIVAFVLLYALKSTLFSVWIPTIVVLNYKPLKALRTSVKMVFKRFGRIFSNAIGIVLTILVLNIVLGLFTFFVGLLVSVPMSFLLIATFGMVVVYEGQGMRYYVDVYNVISPQKKEVSDKFRDMKYIV